MLMKNTISDYNIRIITNFNTYLKVRLKISLFDNFVFTYGKITMFDVYYQETCLAVFVKELSHRLI
jgi:hypothetical protein